MERYTCYTFILFLFTLSCQSDTEKKSTQKFQDIEIMVDRKEANFSLAGTFSIPEGEGPFPAVLMLTGSGGHTRDQEISGLPMFKVIGEYLTQNGIAVLRMDDRGEGESTGPKVRESTTEQRAEDAATALEFLVQQPGVDPDRIGLLGHSEGTFTASILANQKPEIDFLIMLSPWAIPGSELWTWQQGEILRQEGEFSADKIDGIEKELYNMVNHIGNGGNTDVGFFNYGRAACLAWGDPPEDITDEFITGAFGDLRLEWYEFFFSSNPANELRSLKNPVLAIFGSADIQTPPKLNIQKLTNCLNEAGNENYSIVVLPDEDHFFMTGQGLQPNEHVHGKMEFSQKALRVIDDWLEQQFQF